MSSRHMSLLPRAALRRDREQQVFLYFKRDNPYKKQVINDVILKDLDMVQVVNITY